VQIEETALGPLPALVAGEEPPLVMLSGLWPETGVGAPLEAAMPPPCAPSPTPDGSTT
jgi:hypothetical protein